MTTDDLDALERQLQFDPRGEDAESWHGWLVEKRQSLLALIKRLREAEAKKVPAWRYLDGERERIMSERDAARTRIAQLEAEIGDLRALNDIMIAGAKKAEQLFEGWQVYEVEVEAIIRAFTEWGGPDLANEMSPEAENLRALLRARPDRGINYLRLPRPTL